MKKILFIVGSLREGSFNRLRVDFKDGRIVCDGKHSFIWSWEDEDDEIENL